MAARKHVTTLLIRSAFISCCLAGSSMVAAQQETGILTPLEGPVWKLTEFLGKPSPRDNPKHRPYVQFDAGRMFAWDGCNRLSATYELKEGGVIAIGQIAGTKMVCVYTGDTATSFPDALKAAARMMITGNRLELFDAKGGTLAAFTGTSGLAGTSWRLVQFQASDGSILVPDERGKYTIYFGYADQLSVRIDCNEGSGTWTSPGQNQLEFGALALTRAQCAAGSMNDQIAARWPSIRTYMLKDGHLFLSLMADGGTYEFEPATRR